MAPGLYSEFAGSGLVQAVRSHAVTCAFGTNKLLQTQGQTTVSFTAKNPPAFPGNAAYEEFPGFADVQFWQLFGAMRASSWPHPKL